MPKKHYQKHYKIGTRGSLLALTQCNQARAILERLTGDTFELEIIKTQGDMITDIPLWQLEGANFFTKELDEALLTGRVDLVVHSYKDLGSIRPEGITLAAVTKRTYAHDILLIKNQTIAELNHINEFVVGTSSPRRMVNLELGLSAFLPKGSPQKVTTKVLRGNVNTRIQKLQDGEYDAIVLAMPGIERLALTESSRVELEKLLNGMNFMILPQSEFPSSASQGALAIECAIDRADKGELLNKLQKMQDPDTKEEVSRERIAFNEYGGGCHLAVGINVKKKDNFFIHKHLGVLNGNPVHVSKLEGRDLPHFFVKPKVFNGLPGDDLLVKKLPLKVDLSEHDHLYITSKNCITSLATAPKSLWAAGTKTMKELAALGYWVNGCADSLGDDEIKNLRASKACALMIDTNAALSVLSNDEATSTLGRVIPCYTRVIEQNTDKAFEEKINTSDVFYWTSFFQYKAYIEKFPQIINRVHVCGLGKTYQQFKENNINILPMSSMVEFKNWVNV
ncbi:MAG: hydroxymethylbilane synthase [Bacteriovorax sp.]|nr:hydroxymethylbilane synthase [Bacteriovorax sp.]